MFADTTLRIHRWAADGERVQAFRLRIVVDFREHETMDADGHAVSLGNDEIIKSTQFFSEDSEVRSAAEVMNL